MWNSVYPMCSYILVPSINEVKSLHTLNTWENNNVKIIIIDEGNEWTRKRNRSHLEKISYEHYGPKERKNWFKSRFGKAYKKYLNVIPKKCHAETSFGLLVAYEEQADIVIEVDDDVYFNNNFVKEHAENITEENSVTVHAKEKWYNTLENLTLNVNFPVFPRGHPHDPHTRRELYKWTEKGTPCVLNMGLWLKNPDLSALTIVEHGGLQGRCQIESKDLKRDKVIVGEGTYFAVCSMNTSFKRRVIPAFYQLYMNFMGIDRYDDIWSGIFLKKIADHLKENMCIGKPIGIHRKHSRNIFNDLRKELEGMIINEKLWRLVDEIDFSSKNYADCYLELAEFLEKKVTECFQEPLHVKFLGHQTNKMRLWVDILDKLC